MSNIFIEKNGEGEFEVKEAGKRNPVATAKTQQEAEKKAHQLYPDAYLDVERVRKH